MFTLNEDCFLLLCYASHTLNTSDNVLIAQYCTLYLDYLNFSSMYCRYNYTVYIVLYWYTYMVNKKLVSSQYHIWDTVNYAVLFCLPGWILILFHLLYVLKLLQYCNSLSWQFSRNNNGQNDVIYCTLNIKRFFS